MSESFDVDLAVTVRVTVNDDDVIERITGPDGDNWREHLYDLETREDVLYHLASNCVRNGVENTAILDGWADLAVDAATMEVRFVELTQAIPA